jgi:hypothetical protein
VVDDEMLSKVQALDRDPLGPKLPASYHVRKTIVTLFIGVNSIDTAKILPDGQKATREYFKDEILHAISRRSLGGWQRGVEPIGRCTLTTHPSATPKDFGKIGRL